MQQPAVGESYAAIWREGDGPLMHGKARLTSDGLRLEGSAIDGRLTRVGIRYTQIEGVRIGRGRDERLNSRPTLVLERSSGPPLQVDVVGAGMLFELADLLAALTSSHRQRHERVTLIVPLKATAIEHARTLLAAGPPFDPADKGFTRHEVFITDSEAVFLFEGPEASEVVQRLARDPGAWRAAIKWRPLLAGAPRLGRTAYAWQQPSAPTPQL